MYLCMLKRLSFEATRFKGGELEETLALRTKCLAIFRSNSEILRSNSAKVDLAFPSVSVDKVSISRSLGRSNSLVRPKLSVLGSPFYVRPLWAIKEKEIVNILIQSLTISLPTGGVYYPPHIVSAISNASILPRRVFLLVEKNEQRASVKFCFLLLGIQKTKHLRFFKQLTINMPYAINNFKSDCKYLGIAIYCL